MSDEELKGMSDPDLAEAAIQKRAELPDTMDYSELVPMENEIVRRWLYEQGIKEDDQQ